MSSLKSRNHVSPQDLAELLAVATVPSVVQTTFRIRALTEIASLDTKTLICMAAGVSKSLAR